MPHARPLTASIVPSFPTPFLIELDNSHIVRTARFQLRQRANLLTSEFSGDRRMETYPWPSDCRTDWQSVPVNLDLRVAEAAQAARSPQGATPAVGKGSVKWRAGLADSRDLLRAWQ